MLRPFSELVALVDAYSRHYGLSESDAHKTIRRDLREILTMTGAKRSTHRTAVKEARAA